MLSPRRRFPLTLLAALLLALPLAAQEAEPEEAEPEPESETSASAEPAGSPFEYEASEQISEDLSVSFPVDI